MLDLDLLRLAAPAEEFDRYSREVFVELHRLAPAADDREWRAFATRGARFFARLLARPYVFSTPQCVAPCDTAALRSLRAAVSHVSRSGNRETA